ncbi:hypothetical protein, partial [Escherichia coli]|uniref:hypothetical protein n=1 Tax=Escherichia coli TaxID=562 RepID=UPI001BAE56BF
HVVKTTTLSFAFASSLLYRRNFASASQQEKQLKNQYKSLCISLNSFYKLPPGIEQMVFFVSLASHRS